MSQKVFEKVQKHVLAQQKACKTILNQKNFLLQVYRHLRTRAVYNNWNFVF